MRADAAKPEAGALLARGRTLLCNAAEGAYGPLVVPVRTVAPVTRLVDGSNYWLRVWVQPTQATAPAALWLDEASVTPAGQSLRTCSTSAASWSTSCAGSAAVAARQLAFLPTFEALASPSCEDRVTNGDEPGRDCGTACGKACGRGSVCFEDRDCGAAGVCRAGSIGPGQTDSRCGPASGEQQETCSCLPKLAVGLSCGSSTDCQSGLCQGSSGASLVPPRCVPSTCNDGQKNGDETAVDCGGSCARLCGEGAGCTAGRDCDRGLLCGGDVKPLTCRLAKPEGVVCAKDWECGSGACVAKVCRLPGRTGDACDGASDCDRAACTGGKCALPTYADRIRNGTETDVDCGGAGTGFKACLGGQKCAVGADCKAGLSCASGLCGAPVGAACEKAAECHSGLCAKPAGTTKLACLEKFPDGDARHCSNGVRDADESDLDCGGGVCTACADRLKCAGPSDCMGGVCSPAGACAPATCMDGVRNGDETAIDCGGPKCGKCLSGVAVSDVASCASKVRSEDFGVCLDATCFDGQQNGPETGVDCGGGYCAPCASGQACKAAGDCTTRVCSTTTKACAAATASDRVKNGDESDVDCGGSSGKPCALKLACHVTGDCVPGAACHAGLCAPDTCVNGTFDKAKGELDIDCGGPCGLCPTGKTCTAGNQCASGVCAAPAGTIAKKCAAPAPGDGLRNGDELGVDCGGANAPGCGYAQACLLDRDCAGDMVCTGGRCNFGACGASTRSGGGASCGRMCSRLCGNNEPCRGDVDCGDGRRCAAGQDGPRRCVRQTCNKDGKEYRPFESDPSDPCVMCAADASGWVVRGPDSACDDREVSTYGDRCVAVGGAVACRGTPFTCLVGAADRCVGSKRPMPDGQRCSIDSDCVVTGTDSSKLCVNGRCEGPSCGLTLKPAGTICGATSGACSAGGVCDGTGATCPEARPLVGIVCRAASSACDTPEYCGAGSLDCPPDSWTAAGGTCAGGHCGVDRVCVGCSPGQRWDAETGACVSCPEGQVSAGGAATTCTAGVNCPANKYWPGTGTTCLSCPAGTTSPGGAVSSCSNGCPAGTFLPAGAASCTAWKTCAAGEGYAPGTVTTDATCTPCTGASYSSGGTMACTPWRTCAAGQGFTAGTASTDSTCTACPVGMFSTGVTMACTPWRNCSPSEGWSAGTASTNATCTPCAAGQASAGGTAACASIGCAAGQYWSGAMCVACAAGYTSPGGNVTSCSDVNECATGASTCSVNAACTNTSGSFSCTCNNGYY